MGRSDRLNAFVKEISKDIPIKISYKTESKLMRLIGFILFFNRGFMNGYITTIGSTIYFPTREFVKKFPNESMLAIAHEYVHIKDSKRLGFIYPFVYLFPQIFAIFSLLSIFAFITPYALLSLFFLLFVLPIPSPGRKYIELRGYKMTLYAYYIYIKELNKPNKEKLLKDQVSFCNTNFTGPSYYYMWPFGVEKELNTFVDQIINDKVPDEDVYIKVKNALKNSK